MGFPNILFMASLASYQVYQIVIITSIIFWIFICSFVLENNILPEVSILGQ